MVVETDLEILGWIENHLESLYTVGKAGETITVVEWTDSNGNDMKTEGKSLRDCVLKAANGKLIGTVPCHQSV